MSKAADWLDDEDARIAARPNCSVCRKHGEHLADIETLVERLRAGQTRVSIKKFFEDYLQPNGYVGALDALRRHIRGCLGYVNERR